MEQVVIVIRTLCSLSLFQCMHVKWNFIQLIEFSERVQVNQRKRITNPVQTGGMEFNPKVFSKQVGFPTQTGSNFEHWLLCRKH